MRGFMIGFNAGMNGVLGLLYRFVSDATK